MNRQGESMNIDTDEAMNRHYIPVCDKWEIQTKGSGSSFRIAKTDGSGQRWLVLDPHLHAALEEMARDINAYWKRLAEEKASKNPIHDALEDKADLASKAMRQAWQFGQTYWQQADSEYTSQHKRADETQAKFQKLVDETRAAILADVTPNARRQLTDEVKK